MDNHETALIMDSHAVLIPLYLLIPNEYCLTDCLMRKTCMHAYGHFTYVRPILEYASVIWTKNYNIIKLLDLSSMVIIDILV